MSGMAVPVVDIHQHLWTEPLLGALSARRERPRLRRDGLRWRLEVDGEPPSFLERFVDCANVIARNGKELQRNFLLQRRMVRSVYRAERAPPDFVEQFEFAPAPCARAPTRPIDRDRHRSECRRQTPAARRTGENACRGLATILDQSEGLRPWARRHEADAAQQELAGVAQRE